MITTKTRYLTGLSLVVALSAPAAAGQPGQPLPRDEGSGVTIRLGGPATVPADRRVEALVVVGDRTHVAGTVADALVIVGGTARVDGTVLGDVTVIGGTLTLGPTAHVGRNVSLLRSRLERLDGSVVGGNVQQTVRWPGTPLRWLLWLVLGGAVVLMALLVVGLAPETMEVGAALLRREPAAAGLIGILFWICAPAVSILAILTVVGIPVGIALLVFVLPVVWFAGYVTAGAVIGTMLAGALTTRGRPLALLAGTVLGVALLQLVLLIPYVGFGLTLVVGYVESGALVWHAWRQHARTTDAPTRNPGVTARPATVLP
jgi:hypothetical protein